MKLHTINDPPPPEGQRRKLHSTELTSFGNVLPELSDLGLTMLAHLIMNEQQRRARRAWVDQIPPEHR